MKPPCLLLFALLATLVRCQDVLVATEKGLLITNAEDTREILRYENSTAISGYRTVPLAVDSINSRVFYSVPQQSPDGLKLSGLMYVNVHQNPKPQPVMLLFTDRDLAHVRGLAYDEITGILYWTNMIRRSIWKCTITGGCQATPLKRLQKTKEPAGIAVHPCRGYLFWTDNNYTSPSVNRITLRDKSSTVIAHTDLFMPNGLAIDTSDPGRVYWADDSEGDAYKIESADLDGKNRVTEHRGYYQTPMDLAFLPPSDERPKGALYWSDWTGNRVWTLDLNNKSKGPSELAFDGGHRDRPMGVVTKDSLQKTTRC